MDTLHNFLLMPTAEMLKLANSRERRFSRPLDVYLHSLAGLDGRGLDGDSLDDTPLTSTRPES